MGEKVYYASCNTVPTLVGSEVRFSFTRADLRPIPNLPIKYVTCDELTPPQLRTQWGLTTQGARADLYSGLRMGSDKWYLEVGSRSTYADRSSPLKDVETQTVGVVTASLGGAFRISYWNDHAFSFWKPIGGGLPFFEKVLTKQPGRQWDFGDTAGLKLSWDLSGGRGIPVSDGSPWRFDHISLTMRLATGIPEQTSVVNLAGHKFYSRIDFQGVDRGDLNLNAGFGRGDQRLDVGLWLNSGALRHIVQSKFVHQSLDIPQLPPTDVSEVLLYLRWSGL